MKNKTLFFAIAILLFNISCIAQVEKAEISFTKSVYQFGTVKEEAADVIIEFEFTNTGSSLLTVRDVKAEPGLNVTEWTKTSLKPGEKGHIHIVFHPKGHPNRIYKKVTVYSNATKSVETLSVVGNVTPIPGSVADKYRKTLGATDIRMKNAYVTFGNVSNKEAKEFSIEIINDSDTEAKLAFRNVPKQITVEAQDEILQPHQESSILVTYNGGLNKNADGSQKWGAQNDRFYVVINDDTKSSSRNSISVRASITEDFDNLSAEEMANAPKIKFDNLVFNFGTIKQGDVVKHDFTFTNLGESDLEIRHVKAT